MRKNSSCIFCDIVRSPEEMCHKVWESETHLAFLSIFPNTEGVTVVIPKHHITSYVFDATEEEICSLMYAAKIVAKKIDEVFSDVGRTGVIFEGFGVDHLHVKLFPMHGTGNMSKWRPLENNRNEYYTEYPGFLSSHDSFRADDGDLKEIAEKIRKSLDM